ncbi:PilW family protein [Pseudoduganella sp. UC29_106]|uniref:PilW family protein n=1 Tax=Pseudoduganella sp. UC29_106 TaxID=3374553 RepID=UPI0037584AD6
MVASTVGLLLTLVATTMLLAANASYLNTGASTRVDDSGRFALAILAQSIRQAGYHDNAGTPAVEPAAITGLDAASLRPRRLHRPSMPAEANRSDVLLIHFTGSADGAIVNCAGFDETGEHAWSIFYVAKADDGEAELRCKYKGASSWASDAIVRGVDSFQVLYGIDTDTPRDGIANQYLTASTIAALDGEIDPVGATAEERDRDRAQKSNWRRVVAVRVALLLHGEFGSRPPGSLLQRYELFEGEPAVDEAMMPTPLQRRVRRVFTATYAVRNL